MKNGGNTKNNNDILFKKDFYLICIANLCTCMAIYSVMPVLPLYLIDVLHCKESVMGIGLAAFPLVALAVRPFSGMMSSPERVSGITQAAPGDKIFVTQAPPFFSTKSNCTSICSITAVLSSLSL